MENPPKDLEQLISKTKALNWLDNPPPLLKNTNVYRVIITRNVPKITVKFNL
jgi:hypothetical protein